MPDGISPMTLFTVFVSLIILNIVIVYCYRRYSKRDMKKQMDH